MQKIDLPEILFVTVLLSIVLYGQEIPLTAGSADGWTRSQATLNGNRFEPRIDHVWIDVIPQEGRLHILVEGPDEVGSRDGDTLTYYLSAESQPGLETIFRYLRPFDGSAPLIKLAKGGMPVLYHPREGWLQLGKDRLDLSAGNRYERQGWLLHHGGDRLLWGPDEGRYLLEYFFFQGGKLSSSTLGSFRMGVVQAIAERSDGSIAIAGRVTEKADYVVILASADGIQTHRFSLKARKMTWVENVLYIATRNHVYTVENGTLTDLISWENPFRPAALETSASSPLLVLSREAIPTPDGWEYGAVIIIEGAGLKSRQFVAGPAIIKRYSSFLQVADKWYAVLLSP